MTTAALILFEALRLLLRLMLLVFSGHFLRSALAARGGESPSARPPEEWPTVTVQLPMRNEYHVAERIIRAACTLDYPPDRLQIQVLDDSDDQTRQRVAACVEELAGQGHPVELVTREVPEGFKAGALNQGLERARGDFVAIFDADSLPPADFLKANLPYFTDERVGVVQVRWEFADRGRSVLGRVQSTIFDGLFAVDQVVRSRRGMPLQFNGNNGIWRRRCLEETGPWRTEMLTEDADLSFRAYFKGWRIVHRHDYAVPTEIPQGMAAFRTQQKRWATGSAQVLRQLAGQILGARIAAGAKLTMLLHLARHSIYPLIVLSCIFAPLTTLYGMPFWINYGGILNLALLSLLTGSMLVYYRQAQKQVGQPSSQMIWIPLIIVLAIGMSIVYSAAFFRGLTRRGGEFVRTPKQGSASEAGAGAGGPRYRSPWDPLSLVEILFGAAQVAFGIIAHLQGNWINGTFIGLAGISFLWVGLGSSAPGQVQLTGSRRVPATSTR